MKNLGFGKSTILHYNCLKSKVSKLNLHISPSTELDYPAVLSPCASGRLTTPGCFEQHSLLPSKKIRTKINHLHVTIQGKTIYLQYGWGEGREGI